MKGVRLVNSPTGVRVRTVGAHHEPCSPFAVIDELIRSSKLPRTDYVNMASEPSRRDGSSRCDRSSFIHT